jgi:hypothetical protein
MTSMLSFSSDERADSLPSMRPPDVSVDCDNEVR